MPPFLGPPWKHLSALGLVGTPFYLFTMQEVPLSPLGTHPEDPAFDLTYPPDVQR